MQSKKVTPKCFTIITAYCHLLTSTEVCPVEWRLSPQLLLLARRWVTLIRRPTSNGVRLASLQSSNSTSVSPYHNKTGYVSSAYLRPTLI